MKILVLNGPNLDRLGKRQPEIYGSETLETLTQRLEKKGAEAGVDVEVRQSNHEGVLIDWVHEAADNKWPVVINPGGLTHTSVALRDAAVELGDGPGFVEVHISNVFARESFRHYSYLSPVARGVIAGLGLVGYELAMQVFINDSKEFQWV